MINFFNFSKSKYAGYIILLSPILMYFRFLPINTETQPIIGILMLFFLFRYNFTSSELIMLFFIIYTFFIGLISYVYLGGNIIELFNYIFGPLLFIATPVNFKINKKIFVSIHILLIAILFIQRFDIFLLSGILDKLIHFFIPTRMYTSSGITDTDAFVTPVSGLAPEPSYIAHQIVFLHLLAEIAYEKNIMRISLKELNFFRLLLLLYIFLTPSMTIIALVLLCFLPVGKKYLIWFALLILFTFFALKTNIYFLQSFGTLRLSAFFDRFINFDFNNFGWHSLFLLDSSGSTRIYTNVIGYLISFERPFGVGPGNYGHNWDLAFNNYNIQSFFIHPHISEWYNTGQKAPSYFGNYSSDIGFVGFIPFVSFIIFMLIKLKKTVTQKSIRNILIFLFFFSCNITNPIPWFLLAFYKKEFNLENNFNYNKYIFNKN